jgi:hypothetical protein
MSTAGTSTAYIARLWEHPSLCVSLFGVQFLTDAGRERYESSGVGQEVFSSIEGAMGEGLLLARPLMSDEGPVIMQYWRSYDDLDRWARKLPHSRWWRWLLENVGDDLGFYHEIYQARTAEAIYETGTRPVGPALFCTTEEVKGGEGRSRDRQRRFAEAHDRRVA